MFFFIKIDLSYASREDGKMIFLNVYCYMYGNVSHEIASINFVPLSYFTPGRRMFCNTETFHTVYSLKQQKKTPRKALVCNVTVQTHMILLSLVKTFRAPGQKMNTVNFRTEHALTRLGM